MTDSNREMAARLRRLVDATGMADLDEAGCDDLGLDQVAVIDWEILQAMREAADLLDGKTS